MNKYKQLFSLPGSAHYINCAYTAPMSKRVEEAALSALEQKRNPATFSVDDFFDPADKVRREFAAICGCNDPQRIAIIPSASYGLATVARNLRISEKHNVVLAEELFPSSYYTWDRLVKETGGSLRVIKRPAGGDDVAPRWNAALLDAIDSDTSLVCTPHVHWTDGTVFDLDALRAKTSQAGALLVVDGTQSVGALPFDFNAFQPDAIICAGYKWLTGPMGLGVAYFGPAFDGGVPLEENWITRVNSRDFAGLVNYVDDYHLGAIRYDVGERGIGLLLPMLAAGLEQVNEWGPATIQQHCREITDAAFSMLADMGFSLPDSGAPRHLFGVRLAAGVDRNRLVDELHRRQISVSLRSDAVRVSPHLYNDTSDLDALVEAFGAALASQRSDRPVQG